MPTKKNKVTSTTWDLRYLTLIVQVGVWVLILRFPGQKAGDLETLAFTGPIWDLKYVCFDGHDDIARKVPVFKVKIFIFSFERRSWEGANAEQRRRRRNSAKSRRRFNVDVLRWRHLHPHGGGEGPVVVRQPTWALHGAARQDWFRPILLW